MRLIANPKVSSVESWEELRQKTSNFFELLVPIINGNVEFAANIRASFGEINVPAANQVVGVSHNMPAIPQGYLIIYQSAGAVIFAADPAQYPWTSSQIFLTASAPVTARVILI